jgi:hypothetical protein
MTDLGKAISFVNEDVCETSVNHQNNMESLEKENEVTEVYMMSGSEIPKKMAATTTITPNRTFDYISRLNSNKSPPNQG